jgi:hypothetical protein
VSDLDLFPLLPNFQYFDFILKGKWLFLSQVLKISHAEEVTTYVLKENRGLIPDLWNLGLIDLDFIELLYF